MLGQRRRRWPNIEPAFDQRLVCAGTTLYRSANPKGSNCLFKSKQLLPFDFAGYRLITDNSQ